MTWEDEHYRQRVKFRRVLAYVFMAVVWLTVMATGGYLFYTLAFR